jgi:predicted dehydrogenase
MKRFVVGIIGAGDISDGYIPNLQKFPDIELAAIGDLDPARAKARAEEFGIPVHGAPEVVYDDPRIDLVVNLTIPAAHYIVTKTALLAGKHVWTEKPFTIDRASGQELLDLAASKGLRIGVAPDTLLGPGMQTVRRMIANGEIGNPFGASTMFQGPGPIRRPDPEFMYRKGAGPVFDMGPYYFSALIQVFGPVDRVAAVSNRLSDTRPYLVGPNVGKTMPVEVDLNTFIILKFRNGATAQCHFSFEAQHMRQGFFEIYGSTGTTAIPDPNRFTGPLKIARLPEDLKWRPLWDIEWTEHKDMPTELRLRGLGILDMARSIEKGQPHIASAEVGMHVVDILVGIAESAETGEFVKLKSTVGDIPMLPEDWDPFARTE